MQRENTDQIEADLDNLVRRQSVHQFSLNAKIREATEKLGETRYFLLILIVVIIAIYFMTRHKCALPEATSFGKRCGNPISNWLYDYQTLLAGMLAVAAAYLTMRTMNRNTRDLLYASWKTIVFAVMSQIALMEGLITRIAVQVVQPRPDDHDAELWKQRIAEALVSEQRLLQLLRIAEMEGLHKQSLGLLAEEIELAKDFFARHVEAAKMCFDNGEFTAAKLDMAETILQEIGQLAGRIKAGSLDAFKSFVENSKTYNPMALHI